MYTYIVYLYISISIYIYIYTTVTYFLSFFPDPTSPSPSSRSHPSPRSDPWLQLIEGHSGACRHDSYVMTCKYEKSTLHLAFSGFNDGSFVPFPEAPHGWHARNSHGDQLGKQAAPLFWPVNVRQNLPVDCFQTSNQQLALPCAILALQAEGYQVLEVLAADRLHGFGLRAGIDLLLAVKSLQTLKTSIAAVYFHPLMTGGAFGIDNMEKFSHQHFDHNLFEDVLDAALCEHINLVLAMWHIDLIRTLQWTLSSIPSALRRFRRQLAKQWFVDSETRIEHFNSLLQQELMVQKALEPLLLELPKTVCPNLSCPAGTDCAKHHHLFQIPVSRICPGGEKCPRNHPKRKLPCRRHHCRGQQGPWNLLSKICWVLLYGVMVLVFYFDSIHSYLGVSKNRGIPKSSILIGFFLINHPFWDTLIFGNTHLFAPVHGNPFLADPRPSGLPLRAALGSFVSRCSVVSKTKSPKGQGKEQEEQNLCSILSAMKIFLLAMFSIVFELFEWLF